jgi:bifunctional NMN adenylyltransferase/nudix hydrolase
MKKTYTPKKKKIGVVIGRFQVARLHVGHRYLLDTALHDNDELCILLGSTGGAPTKRNPLSFTHRKEMMEELYPKAKIFEIIDSKIWSENLDALLTENFDGHHVRLYGSRDSFAKEYFGGFEVVHVPALHAVSGTEMRSMFAKPKEKESFRQGIIESHKLRYPISYQTVDMLVCNVSKKEILLGKKKNSIGWHLPGGFVDPTDTSLEDAVVRELQEEVLGLVVRKPITYLGSYRVHDHRYRNEEDKIMTALFLVPSTSKHVRAGDDLEEVAWFSFDEAKKRVDSSHAPLLELFFKKVK